MINLFGIALSAFILLLALICIYLYYKSCKAKYLVFSSVGDINNVQSWISEPSKKNFDFVMYYYGEKDAPSLDADLVIKRKGLKFDNFHHFLKHNNVSQYKAIWVADDDMIIDTESINKMFKLFTRYKLHLAQPSFRKGSKLPWKITQNNPDCILRYTNFIENNAAIFSTNKIPLFLDTFSDAGTGFGVDFIWPSLLNFPKDKIAVIDAVCCQHPITDYSALDEVVPRHLHKLQGIELLIKYGLLPNDHDSTENYIWRTPYKPREYSRVVNTSRF